MQHLWSHLMPRGGLYNAWGEVSIIPGRHLYNAEGEVSIDSHLHPSSVPPAVSIPLSLYLPLSDSTPLGVEANANLDDREA